MARRRYLTRRRRLHYSLTPALGGKPFLSCYHGASPTASPQVRTPLYLLRKRRRRWRKTKQEKEGEGKRRKWALKSGMTGVRETQGKGPFPYETAHNKAELLFSGLPRFSRAHRDSTRTTRTTVSTGASYWVSVMRTRSYYESGKMTSRVKRIPHLNLGIKVTHKHRSGLK